MPIADSEVNAESLLLIDGHALAFDCWFSNDPPNVMPGFIKRLESAMNRYQPSHLLVAFDPPPPTFRHRMYPLYKATRPPVPPRFLEQCEQVFSALDSAGVSNVMVEGYEADDVLGTATTQAEQSGIDTHIMTCDLDLLQLISPNVTVEVFSQYWPTRLFDEESTRARFSGLEVSLIPDFKALVGDRSDNLPGIRGIGVVAASSILANYGKLEEVYEDVGRVALLSFRGANRAKDLLEINRSEAFFMRDLSTIRREVSMESGLDEWALDRPLQRIES